MGARFSTPVQTGPGAHPASCTMGTGSFPGVKSGRDVTLTPHFLLVPWSRKSRAIPLPPYGPYGLYRCSVPVQGCTLPFNELSKMQVRDNEISQGACRFQTPNSMIQKLETPNATELSSPGKGIPFWGVLFQMLYLRRKGFMRCDQTGETSVGPSQVSHLRFVVPAEAVAR